MSRSRPISSFMELRPYVTVLKEAGVDDVADLDMVEDGDALVEIRGILNRIREECPILSLDFSSGFSRSERDLPTFSEGLDRLLGGRGFPAGCLTELAGEAGTGKTQFCLQLCANVQLPSRLGGLGGRVVYIDADGGFCAERLKQVADATLVNAFKAMGCPGKLKESLKKRLSLRNMMDGVLCTRAKNADELFHVVVDKLPKLLLDHPDLRLVIIDSIAFHFRYVAPEDGPSASNSRMLHEIGQKLQKLAYEHDLVTVITNQMTFNPFLARTVPALGDAWAHVSSTRLILSYTQDRAIRRVTMEKSSMFPHSTEVTLFCITADGIRDFVSAN